MKITEISSDIKQNKCWRFFFLFAIRTRHDLSTSCRKHSTSCLQEWSMGQPGFHAKFHRMYVFFSLFPYILENLSNADWINALKHGMGELPFTQWTSAGWVDFKEQLIFCYYNPKIHAYVSPTSISTFSFLSCSVPKQTFPYICLYCYFTMLSLAALIWLRRIKVKAKLSLCLIN
jgi:hypothetical protein